MYSTAPRLQIVANEKVELYTLPPPLPVPHTTVRGAPGWVRKISIINRRGERCCLLASRGAIPAHDGLGAALLRGLREARVPVQVTFGDGSVSGLEVQRAASDVQRLLVLCVDDEGGRPGSLRRHTGVELAAIAGEHRDRVTVLSVQPGAWTRDALVLEAGTADAVSRQILDELL